MLSLSHSARLSSLPSMMKKLLPLQRDRRNLLPHALEPASHAIAPARPSPLHSAPPPCLPSSLMTEYGSFTRSFRYRSLPFAQSLHIFVNLCLSFHMSVVPHVSTICIKDRNLRSWEARNHPNSSGLMVWESSCAFDALKSYYLLRSFVVGAILKRNNPACGELAEIIYFLLSEDAQVVAVL